MHCHSDSPIVFDQTDMGSFLAYDSESEAL